MTTAYRFSSEELTQMVELKKLFENNGYEFQPNRFPEVYYMNKADAEIAFGFQLKNEYNEPGNADYLGVYVSYNNTDTSVGKYREGVIILFKDRIEKYSQTIASKENTPAEEMVTTIRFIVLMHELGHWLTHMAYAQSTHENWGKFYDTNHKNTHEALAQLIAYWASNEYQRDILKRHLTPDPKNGDDPYNQYLHLVKKTRKSILTKLIDIREIDLEDEVMLNFLKGKFNTFIDEIDHFARKSELYKLDDNQGYYIDVPREVIVNLYKEMKRLSRESEYLNKKKKIYNASAFSLSRSVKNLKDLNLPPFNRDLRGAVYGERFGL